MPVVDGDKEVERSRRTMLLLIGGVASLLIPLAGVAYMQWKDAKATGTLGLGTQPTFEQRRGETALAPSATPAPDSANGPLAQVPQMPVRENSPAPTQNTAAAPVMGGSLSFIRGGSDMSTAQQPQATGAMAQAAARGGNDSTASAPAAAAPPGAAPPQQKTVAQAQPAAQQQKPAYKPFNAPRLSGTRFGGGAQQQAGAQGQGGPAGAQGGAPNQNPAEAVAAMQNMQGMLKNAPGGGAGMPDMGAMMKNMPAGAAGAPGMPDMSKLMQQGQQK